MDMTTIIKNTISHVCPLCEHENYLPVYVPQNSALNAVVHLCSRCAYVGLITSGIPSQNRFRPNILSCDADYSTIRVGKEQMLEQSWNMISKFVDLAQCRKVLDLSSARGHFARRILSEIEFVEITCLEPDEYMTHDYSSLENLKMIRSSYELEMEIDKFDLIYSCHSLEHYRSPLSNLRLMLNHLSPEGSIYLEVPNAEAMTSGSVLEEFFYDQHKSYFCEPVLCSAIRAMGFEICHTQTDSGSIRLILKGNGKQETRTTEDASRSLLIRSQVEIYAERLSINRSLLPSIISGWELDSPNKSLGVVGCGRMLDALITYGGLKVDDETQLYDSILSKIEYFKRGNQVLPLSSITANRPDQVVIAANSSSKQLCKLVKELSPESEVFSIVMDA